jgi:hypothetical protein
MGIPSTNLKIGEPCVAKAIYLSIKIVLRALYMTARVGAKMMKWMIKFAFYLPGMVRRLAAKANEPLTRKK